MALLEETRASALIALAAKYDGKLSDGELEVLRRSAGSAGLHSSLPLTAKLNIRPEFLRWLATDAAAADFIDPRGIRVFCAQIIGDLDLEKCTIPMALEIVHSEISGQIKLDSATTQSIAVRHVTANAFCADTALIHGSVDLSNSVLSGNSSITGSKIEGHLLFHELNLQNSGIALTLDGSIVQGYVFMDERFNCLGSVRLHSVQMSGLDCSRANLPNQQGSFSLDGAKIGGDVFLQAVNCRGEFRLSGASITGDLDFCEAKIESLVCPNMRLEGDLILTSTTCKALNLLGASVKTLRDSPGSWPSPGWLTMDGLTYTELNLLETPPVSTKDELTYDEIVSRCRSTTRPLNIDDRIKWLRLQEGEHLKDPQPWTQLASYLESQGHKRNAREVLYQFALEQAKDRNRATKLWLTIFAWLEEQPFRILWSIVFLLVIGSLTFGTASSLGIIAPKEKDAYAAWAKGEPYPNAYPLFDPVIYTLENELPLVKLGEDDKWGPDSKRTCKKEPATNNSICCSSISASYVFLTWSRWLLILLGWMQATVLAAAVRGHFK
jgi:hypothetical protein